MPPRLPPLRLPLPTSPPLLTTRSPLRLRPLPSPTLPHAFSTTAPLPAPTRNRVYTPIRDPASLSTLLLLSASSRTSLITLWTTSYCGTCAVVAPIVRNLVEREGVGEGEGGRAVGFVEVEMDAVEMGEMGWRYLITAVPTLLAFSRGEPQVETKVTRGEELRDREFLRGWIEREAERGGKGGAGGLGLLGRLLGLGRGG